MLLHTGGCCWSGMKADKCSEWVDRVSRDAGSVVLWYQVPTLRAVVEILITCTGKLWSNPLQAMENKGNMPCIFQGGISLDFLDFSILKRHLKTECPLLRQETKLKNSYVSKTCPAFWSFIVLEPTCKKRKKKWEIAVPSYHLSVKCLHCCALPSLKGILRAE